MKQHKSKFNGLIKEFNIYNKLRKNFESEIVKKANSMLDRYLGYYKNHLNFNAAIEEHKSLLEAYLNLCENINHMNGRVIESKWLELNVNFEALRMKWQNIQKDFKSMLAEYMYGVTDSQEIEYPSNIFSEDDDNDNEEISQISDSNKKSSNIFVEERM